MTISCLYILKITKSHIPLSLYIYFFDRQTKTLIKGVQQNTHHSCLLFEAITKKNAMKIAFASGSIFIWQHPIENQLKGFSTRAHFYDKWKSYSSKGKFDVNDQFKWMLTPRIHLPQQVGISIHIFMSK